MSLNTELNQSTIEQFMPRSSFAGLMFLYFLKIAHQKSIGITIKEFFEISEHPSDEQYLYGFIVACSALNVLDFTKNGDIINVTNYNKYLDDSIYMHLIDKAKYLDENSTTSIYRMKSIEKLHFHYKVIIPS